MMRPVGGVAVGNYLSINIQHSVNDFHYQLRNLPQRSIGTRHRYCCVLLRNCRPTRSTQKNL